jgi:hypothetical protein
MLPAVRRSAEWVRRRCQAPVGAVRLPFPGRYVTDQFQPSLSFEVGKGWEVSGLRQKPFFQIEREYQGGDSFVALACNNAPTKVSAPTNPNKLVPAPEDWVSWFQEHPYLETSEPMPASVGGGEGRRFDTKVSSLPEDYYSETA